MFVDNLRTRASDKLHRVTIEPFDPAQKSDPVHKEHHYLNLPFVKMFKEHVLDRRGHLGGHV